MAPHNFADSFQELDEWMRVHRVVWDARLDRLGAALEKRQQESQAERIRQPAEYKEVVRKCKESGRF